MGRGAAAPPAGCLGGATYQARPPASGRAGSRRIARVEMFFVSRGSSDVTASYSRVSSVCAAARTARNLSCRQWPRPRSSSRSLALRSSARRLMIAARLIQQRARFSLKNCAARCSRRRSLRCTCSGTRFSIRLAGRSWHQPRPSTDRARSPGLAGEPDSYSEAPETPSQVASCSRPRVRGPGCSQTRVYPCRWTHCAACEADVVLQGRSGKWS